MATRLVFEFQSDGSRSAIRLTETSDESSAETAEEEDPPAESERPEPTHFATPPTIFGKLAFSAFCRVMGYLL